MGADARNCCLACAVLSLIKPAAFEAADIYHSTPCSVHLLAASVVYQVQPGEDTITSVAPAIVIAEAGIWRCNAETDSRGESFLVQIQGCFSVFLRPDLASSCVSSSSPP